MKIFFVDCLKTVSMMYKTTACSIGPLSSLRDEGGNNMNLDETFLNET